jgi:serine/threonine protein kinase
VFEEKSRLSLVMELCTGGELYERLQMQNGDHFTEDAAAVITVKILQAVGCCHAHDVVHKDLKCVVVIGMTAVALCAAAVTSRHCTTAVRAFSQARELPVRVAGGCAQHSTD